MKQIAPAELKAWLDDPERADPLLLDVREPWEFDKARIAGSQLFSMATVPARFDELPRDRDIVAICHHGARSYQVAAFLEQKGFTRLHNLSGGVDAWSLQVDSALPRY